MEICDDCPDWGYVARTGKCFDCIGGDLPLEIEMNNKQSTEGVNDVSSQVQ